VDSPRNDITFCHVRFSSERPLLDDENPPAGRYLHDTGKSLFARDCVVGLGGLELPTKQLSVASSEQPPRWPAPAWHGRRSPHRLAGGTVPTAPDARPSCAVIARILEQSLWVVPSCEETEFLRQRRSRRNRFIEIQLAICGEKGSHQATPLVRALR
jgi:hypothetical protein